MPLFKEFQIFTRGANLYLFDSLSPLFDYIKNTEKVKMKRVKEWAIPLSENSPSAII